MNIYSKKMNKFYNQPSSFVEFDILRLICSLYKSDACVFSVLFKSFIN